MRFTHQMPHPPWAPLAGHAVRWSDLLTRAAWLLDIYAEVGKPLAIEYSSSSGWSLPRQSKAASRSTAVTDFSDAT